MLFKQALQNTELRKLLAEGNNWKDTKATTNNSRRVDVLVGVFVACPTRGSRDSSPDWVCGCWLKSLLYSFEAGTQGICLLLRMGAHMTDKGRTMRKPRWALGAGKRLLARVGALVYSQNTASSKPRGALGAGKRPLARVGTQVPTQRRFVRNPRRALGAGERLLARVRAQVRSQVATLRKPRGAHGAGERPLARMRPDVPHQRRRERKRLPAKVVRVPTHSPITRVRHCPRQIADWPRAWSAPPSSQTAPGTTGTPTGAPCKHSEERMRQITARHGISVERRTCVFCALLSGASH